MNVRRWLILILGPIPIVIAALAVSRWAGDDLALASANRIERLATDDSRGRFDAIEYSIDEESALAAECSEVRDRIKSRLGEECHAIVRSPFVVAGDLAESDLENWYERTILPASIAMWDSYFDERPSSVITILLFSEKDVYEAYADELYGDRGISIYGYYKPAQRTLIMNISTGGGTLVHELTHALIDFDFPQVPDWFNEGLASLHEQCRFRQRGEEWWIEGLENWRLPALQSAIEEQSLIGLQELMTLPDFRGSGVGLNYAQARYFCLYLQRQDKLEEFYAQFRDGYEDDPTGERAVEHVLADRSWDELDAAYRAWVLGLTYQ